MKSSAPLLHAVTPADVLDRTDLDARAAAIARGPKVAVHARAPGVPGRTLGALADRLRRATGTTGTKVFVNDRADVAMIVKADGVHVPAAGLPIAAVRALVGPDVWIGRSVHQPEEALEAAEQGADYVFLGPIWVTASHPGRAPLGLEAITRALPARVVAIGGVTPERIAQCRDAGAYGVAAVSALWRANDPASVVDRMLLLLESEC